MNLTDSWIWNLTGATGLTTTLINIVKVLCSLQVFYTTFMYIKIFSKKSVLSFFVVK